MGRGGEGWGKAYRLYAMCTALSDITVGGWKGLAVRGTRFGKRETWDG